MAQGRTAWTSFKDYVGSYFISSNSDPHSDAERGIRGLSNKKEQVHVHIIYIQIVHNTCSYIKNNKKIKGVGIDFCDKTQTWLVGLMLAKHFDTDRNTS